MIQFFCSKLRFRFDRKIQQLPTKKWVAIQSKIQAKTVVKQIRDSCLYFYFRFVRNILRNKRIVESVSQADILSDRLYVV